MSKEAVTRVQKKDVTFGITGFIDILGFGEKVKAAETLDDIRAVDVDIETIRHQFDLRTKDDLTRRVHRLYRKSVLAFSDCVVINVPLSSTATLHGGVFDAVMSELTTYAYAQGECAMRGLFVRGGLGLGWWFRKRDTLISSGLVHAYAREQTAVVPVIALTSDLLEFLSSHGGRAAYAPSIDPITTSFRKYEVKSKRGPVEICYIDYLRICLTDLDWMSVTADRERYLAAPPESEERDQIMQEGYRANVDRWLITHARNIEKAHEAAPPMAKSKYVWLAEYHNETAADFTRTPACRCELGSPPHGEAA